MGKKMDKAKQIVDTSATIVDTAKTIIDILIAAKVTYDKTKGTLGSTDKK